MRRPAQRWPLPGGWLIKCGRDRPTPHGLDRRLQPGPPPCSAVSTGLAAACQPRPAAGLLTGALDRLRGLLDAPVLPCFLLLLPLYHCFSLLLPFHATLAPSSYPLSPAA